MDCCIEVGMQIYMKYIHFKQHYWYKRHNW